jgi:hypothetical protein
MPSKTSNLNKLLILIVGGLFFILPLPGWGKEKPLLKIFDKENLVKEFSVLEENLTGSLSLTTADLDDDKIDEIIVGSPAGEKPEVTVYREDGSLFTKFLAYDENFRGGVKVAAGDLDGDGKKEIITGAGFGGGPHVRIFDDKGQPKFITGFFAFDKNLRNGVNVGTGDFYGDGKNEIIVGSGEGEKPQIKVFDRRGSFLFEINPQNISKWGGVEVASVDLGGDGKDEILAAGGWSSSPEIQIFRADGSLVNKFLVYDSNFRGGINLSSADIDGDGKEEIITGADPTGGPHVKIFDGYGNLKNEFFAFDKNFRGGILVSAGKFEDGKNKIVTLPARINPEGQTDLYKYIEIDISEQKLRFYQNGFELGEYPVSTGTLVMPTPLGTFKIFYKSLVAYSASYNLYMPHFMQFTKSGAGIHGLPYWKTSKGIIYEGVNHLGLRVSHGCVRLSLSAAEKIYGWAGFDTTVIVHP